MIVNEEKTLPAKTKDLFQAISRREEQAVSSATRQESYPSDTQPGVESDDPELFVVKRAKRSPRPRFDRSSIKEARPWRASLRAFFQEAPQRL